MKHWYQKPHPLISEYVRTVLIIEGFSQPDPLMPPPVTNGMPALFSRDGKVTLFLKSVPSACWDVDEHTHIITYFFKPFVAASIFNVDAKINSIELGEVDDLDNFIISKINPNVEIIQYATDQIMIDPNADILSKFKMSERTFQRIFKKYVGITPKQYRRICQFQSTFTQLRLNEFQSLTDLAYANGFADQSHFNRSFKEFTQTTPVNYLKEGLTKK